MAEEMIYDANGNATGFTTVDTEAVVAAAPSTSSFSLGNIFGGARDLLANATGTVRADIGRQLISGMTPESAIDYMASQMITADSTPEHKAAVSDLVTTIKSDPEFAKSFHSAVVNDRTMLPGLMARSGNGSSPDGLKALNETLSDPSNRAVIGKTLDVIARSNNDVFNYAYIEKLEDLTAKKDYAGLQSHLAKAGITDPRLVFATGDLGSMWDMLMENPDQIGGMIAGFVPNGNTLSPEFQDILGKLGISGDDFSNFFKGLAVIAPNVLSTLLGPEFLGYFVDNVFAPIGAAIADKGAAVAGMDITGSTSSQTDAEIAAQTAEAGQGATVDPTKEGVGSNPSLGGAYAGPAAGSYTEDQNKYDQQVASWTTERQRAPEPVAP